MTVKGVEPILTASRAASDVRRVINPLLDFLFLGGASLFVIPAVLFLTPVAAQPQVILAALVLFYFSNYPHFAASYQIFYRGFGAKISANSANRVLRARYIFAGLIIPAAMIGFLAIGLMQPDVRMLGYSVSFVGTFTVWHYLKQGYGMLILDSVFQKRFFSAGEKRVFLYNTYACIILFWVALNKLLTFVRFQGLSVETFYIPTWLFYGVGCIAFLTTLAVLFVFARKLMANRNALPFNGVVAYMATTYLWLIALLNPLTAIIVPIFHALQYLSVVWRYEYNRGKAIKKPTLTIAWTYYAFVMVTMFIAYVGAWQLPEAYMEKWVRFSHEAYDGTIFLFVFWFFVNLHHYFMDNVIWRSENAETRTYLFQGPTNVPKLTKS